MMRALADVQTKEDALLVSITVLPLPPSVRQVCSRSFSSAPDQDERATADAYEWSRQRFPAPSDQLRSARYGRDVLGCPLRRQVLALRECEGYDDAELSTIRSTVRRKYVRRMNQFREDSVYSSVIGRDESLGRVLVTAFTDRPRLLPPSPTTRRRQPGPRSRATSPGPSELVL